MNDKCRLCEGDSLSEYSVFGLYECSVCNFVQRIDEYKPIENSINQDKFRKTSFLDKKISFEKGLPLEIESCFHTMVEDSKRICNFMSGFVEEWFYGKEKIEFIDVGSGYGYTGLNLKKSFPKMNISLMEISEERMNLGIDTFQHDLNEFTFYNEYLDSSFVNKNLKKFDIVFSFHVLEHVYDIVEFMKGLYEITKHNGFIIIEVPNQDDDLLHISSEYDNLTHIPAHVSNFTKDNLSLLLEKSGIHEDVDFFPIQRYGFFNYIDWVRFGKKERVLSDDYSPRNDLTWIERLWLDRKRKDFTTDSIMMILRKFGGENG